MNKQRQMSNETAQLIDAEIKSIVEGGYVRAKEVLTENIDQLHALAKALLEYETLNGDEIKRVMAGEKIDRGPEDRSEEHTSELQSLMRISYAVFCLKKKKTK